MPHRLSASSGSGVSGSVVKARKEERRRVQLLCCMLHPGEHVLGTHWRRCPRVTNALGCQINVHATNWNQDERLAEGLILQSESPGMFPYRPFEILDNLHVVCGEGQGERALAASQHMFHTAKLPTRRNGCSVCYSVSYHFTWEVMRCIWLGEPSHGEPSGLSILIGEV